MERMQTLLRMRWRAAILAWCTVMLVSGFFAVASGCSLFVMGGKMLMGDPMVEADFDLYTGKSLAEEGKKVAVICTTPEVVRSEFSALDIDLLSGLARRLKRAEIDIIQPHRVASWIDDNGGEIEDMTEFGKSLEADYIIHVHLDSFAYREDNSPNLFRGRAGGAVTVWELVSQNEEDDSPDLRFAKNIYSKPFQTVFPSHRPIPVDQSSETVFRKRFLDRLSDELARLFYDYKAGVDF